MGEIWVKGPGVAQGYWRQPEITQTTFRAFTTESEGPFLRTGDLGFLWEGELYFVARQKEMILLDGTNIWPHDLEETIESSHSLLRKGCCAVFTIDNELNEALYVVAETKRDIPLNAQQEKEIIQAIQKSLFVKHSLTIESSCVNLVVAGSIPKTTRYFILSSLLILVEKFNV